MSGTAATGLGTWLVDWLPLAMAGGVGAAFAERPEQQPQGEGPDDVEGQRRHR